MGKLAQFVLSIFIGVSTLSHGVDLTNFVGEYEGIDPEGNQVTVRVTKGFGSLFGKELVIDMVYPESLHVQRFIDFPESMPRHVGNGNVVITRFRFEPPNRIVGDDYLRLFFFNKQILVPRWRHTYELLQKDGKRVLRMQSARISLLRKKEHVYESCEYKLIAATE